MVPTVVPASICTAQWVGTLSRRVSRRGWGWMCKICLGKGGQRKVAPIGYLLHTHTSVPSVLTASQWGHIILFWRIWKLKVEKLINLRCLGQTAHRFYGWDLRLSVHLSKVEGVAEEWGAQITWGKKRSWVSLWSWLASGFPWGGDWSHMEERTAVWRELRQSQRTLKTRPIRFGVVGRVIKGFWIGQWHDHSKSGDKSAGSRVGDGAEGTWSQDHPGRSGC